jgi:hypothetical protein
MPRSLAIAFAVLAVSAFAQVELPEHLGLRATAGLFEKIRAAPGFDLSRPALFGYFFNSEDVAQINAIRSRLEADGFTFVEAHVDKKGRTWLQVAKAEIHSPESLVERNRQFKMLAGEFRSVQYDGWDITRNAR